MAVSTVILGASGYAGQETLDRVLAHPELELVALGSDSLAGQGASVLDPRLNGNVPAFVSNDDAARGRRGARLLLPRPRAGGAAGRRTPTCVVVDLSGAHRLAQPSLYAEWYGFEHPRPQSLPEWSYAMPELFPPTGPLIANPGCYATAVLLALAPLAGVVDPNGVVVDAKSGVSGAGKGAEGELARGRRARERLALQGRHATSTRPRSSRRSASRSASSRTCCPSAAA